jgi:epoxyqueuosine reductase
MKPELLTLARSLGFALCRVAKCSAPPHAQVFLDWLDRGNAGEMAWLERNKARRTDPQLVLPGACSVIVLAMNYWQGDGNEEGLGSPGISSFCIPPSSFPRIARYAWGVDYHDLLDEKLRVLDAFLRGHNGTQKCYTDTGPVLERDFAAAAGAGWHGKSTMLIHPKLGAWFFLAEILTTLVIEPDAPVPDRCGKCTRCINACPTGAITEPRQLDARRCISYLTIELKGSIPVELRPLIGNRIYGCDDCLAACPWNRFAQASSESAFAARPNTNGMTLLDYLALSEDDFRALFRDSPIKRIKRRGFLRNVCVALGNTGGPDDLPALGRAANDPEPLIAEHARWAIGQITARLSA